MISAIDGVDIVGQAKNGAYELEAVECLEADVVVMATRPGVMAQLSRLRQIKAKKNRPIVIILADQPSFSKPKLLSAGADFVFHRSYEFQQLLDLIKTMRGRRLRCHKG